MKKSMISMLLGLVLLLFSTTAQASDQAAVAEDTPPILAALGRTDVTHLDDTAIAGVRGAAAEYVLVRLLGLNTFDFGPGVQWTLNPLGYRYGYWGGPNHSDGFGDGQSYVDTMDSYFMKHDQGDITDLQLIGFLESLRSADSYWGKIYNSSPVGAPEKVYVSGASLIGGKLFFGWKPMPYSEYSRREAVYGMNALLFGKSLLRLQ